MTGHHEYRGEVPLHDHYGPEAKYAVESEALLPTTKWEQEIARGLELGLQGAESIVDKRIPTFSRGELPHFAGINTFLKAPLRRGCPQVRRIRRGSNGCTVRWGHNLSLRDQVRAPGHSKDIGPVRHLLLRDRCRPSRVDNHRRRWRHLHHPRQHREDV